MAASVAMDTTVSQIAAAILAVAEHPEQQRRLRDDPGLALRAVAELIRHTAPVHITMRRATTDVAVGRHVIERGDLVALLIAAANRDPRHYADPDHLDLDRRRVQPLAFGAGPHFCLGAHLAKLTVGTVLTELFRRYPNLGIDGTRTRWRPRVASRQLETLDAELTALPTHQGGTMSTTSLPETKLSRQFHALDLDGDGAVTEADYLQTGQRVLAEFGVDPDSPNGSALLAEYGALFERLRAKADTDGDGRVDEGEFLASITASMDRGNFARAIAPVITASMKVCDADGDGAVSTEELRRWLVAIGGPEADSAEVARRVDVDGDGEISYAEFLALIEDFYIGTDPASPSSLMFGAGQ